MQETLRRVAVLLTFVLMGTSAIGKCPSGRVLVEGRVESESPRGLRVSIVLRTTKGDYSGDAKVTGTIFNIEVPFSTWRSYSPLFGHRLYQPPGEYGGEVDWIRAKARFKPI